MGNPPIQNLCWAQQKTNDMAYLVGSSSVSSEGRARAESRRAWPPSPRWPSSAEGSAARGPNSGSRRRFPECGGGAQPAAAGGAGGAAGVSAGAEAGGAPAVAVEAVAAAVAAAVEVAVTPARLASPSWSWPW